MSEEKKTERNLGNHFPKIKGPIIELKIPIKKIKYLNQIEISKGTKNMLKHIKIQIAQSPIKRSKNTAEVSVFIDF